ncbi:hypothetical protein C5167_031571 [Papaver somniferum]|uniref:Uncharacterized protein n=1 Tax=Papaver somniferum TaxID=3469 RepID=A0A4Y7K8Q0_PAPSO|nr:hypothetical protein C5167_031571 [Papaver somniferum]
MIIIFAMVSPLKTQSNLPQCLDPETNDPDIPSYLNFIVLPILDSPQEPFMCVLRKSRSGFHYVPPNMNVCIIGRNEGKGSYNDGCNWIIGGLLFFEYSFNMKSENQHMTDQLQRQLQDEDKVLAEVVEEEGKV